MRKKELIIIYKKIRISGKRGTDSVSKRHEISK